MFDFSGNTPDFYQISRKLYNFSLSLNQFELFMQTENINK
jgi:hypothetical protein